MVAFPVYPGRHFSSAGSSRSAQGGTMPVKKQGRSCCSLLERIMKIGVIEKIWVIYWAVRFWFAYRKDCEDGKDI